MTDGAGRTRGGTRTTRRGLLALAGASAVAGCSTLRGLADGGGPTIRAYDLPDTDGESDPEPVVPPAVPVDIAPTHFDRARDRVTTLLSTLPTPMGPDDIPNGRVRHHLVDAAADATTGLDDALGARTELVALRSLRHARARARYAAAGWAVADRGLTAATVRREHGRTVSEARSVREGHEYAGADPVRAALVHARIEALLERAADGGSVYPDGELLTVAGWGETAESARAGLADARHLTERFAASLPPDAGTVDATLAGAAEELLADVRSRRSDLPPDPTAEDRGVAGEVVGDLRRMADDGPTRTGDALGPASAVVGANGRLTRLRALNRVRERVDAGETFRVESAGAVREVRAAAYDALAGALENSPAPGMARTAVTDAAWRVANADRELARYEGEVAPAHLGVVVADYVVGTVIARAAPAACRRTVDALEAG